MAVDRNKIITYLPVATVPVGNKGRTTEQVLDYISSRLNDPQMRLSRAIPYSKPELITPKYAWSPEIMSYDKYGTEYLWWFLCRYNAIIHPLHPRMGFVPGNTVNVPAPADVVKWLKSLDLTTTETNRIVTV